MKIDRCKKESFIVIGKEGSITDGADLIQKLWDDANPHFREIAHLAKTDENGNICGIWNAMSDFSHSFQLAIMIKPLYHTYPMTNVMILGTADGNVLEYMLPGGSKLVQIDYKR